MSEKLKPCPFCGGEAELFHVIYQYFVRCSNPNCNVDVETKGKYSPEEAISVWNRRWDEDDLPF